LRAKEHEALLLRFFQHKTFPEIAAFTGSTEEGARKRVARAMEKLRRFLAQRGVVIPVTLLVATISANSVQAAPALASQSLAGLSAASSLSPLAAQTITALRWLKLQWALGGVAALCIAGILALAVYNFQSSTRSPIRTFEMMVRAMNEGDGRLWSGLVHVTNIQEEQARIILASNIVAQADLRKTLLRTFNRADYEASGFPRLLDDTPASEVAGAVEEIKGDRGTVRLPRGATLQFVLIGRHWKFDYFRTARVNPVQIRSYTEGTLRTIRDMERRISAGKYLDCKEAFADIKPNG
jgi:hypothetical protein